MSKYRRIIIFVSASTYLKYVSAVDIPNLVVIKLQISCSSFFFGLKQSSYWLSSRSKMPLPLTKRSRKINIFILEAFIIYSKFR